jgi:ABC-type Mn2+/Zn2+ transport system permease subunit
LVFLISAGRAKKVTKMSEKVATGILSGVVKVTGYFTSSLANSKAGKKFFSLLPGEIVLASLDGFGMCSLFQKQWTYIDTCKQTHETMFV